MRGGGIVASTLLVAIAVVLAVVGPKGNDTPTATEAARIVGPAALTELEDELGHPVYWAGERPPLRIEAADVEGGSVYLRYLPPGVPAGDPRVGFLTVGTYPVPDAVAALRRVAKQAGVAVRRSADGAAILPNSSSRGSVYLAYPNTDIQVEVYDPAPGRAGRMVAAGEIRPVGR